MAIAASVAIIASAAIGASVANTASGTMALSADSTASAASAATNHIQYKLHRYIHQWPVRPILALQPAYNHVLTSPIINKENAKTFWLTLRVLPLPKGSSEILKSELQT